MSKRRQVFLHAIIWFVMLLGFVFIGSRTAPLYEAIIIFLCFGLFNISVFYLNSGYILPKYLSNRRYFACVLTILLLIILSVLLKYLLALSFKDIVLRNDDHYIGFEEYALASGLTTILFIFLSTAYRFAADWFVNEKEKRNLENEKLTAELAFLKSQVNPHFLFNSLNNIYSLAYQKSEKTPEAILKLSEMMRYMLQESNEAKVKLSKELRYLKNYIELQKLRFKSGAFIEMDIEGEEMDSKIAPLILIAFVENAFKHGIASDPDNPIKLSISLSKNHLDFQLSNKKSLYNKDESSGIGLINVKRRLDLLYPGRYKLNITETDFIYNCRLSLDL